MKVGSLVTLRAQYDHCCLWRAWDYSWEGATNSGDFNRYDIAVVLEFYEEPDRHRDNEDAVRVLVGGNIGWLGQDLIRELDL